MKNNTTKTHYSIALFLLAGMIANAQDSLMMASGFDISGYYENRFFPQEIDGKVILQDYNKLRLNFASEVSKQITFNANANFQTYHGQTSYNLLDFMPNTVVDAYVNASGLNLEDILPSFDYSVDNTIFLDNAYLSIYTKHANIRIGKQQLPWGTGYAWNPTDIFNVKDILDPTYEKVGVNAFKAELPFLQMGMLTGILSVGDDWENSTKAIKAKYYVAGFDLSASYAEKRQASTDYYTFQETDYKRQMLGADFSGSIAGMGIWGEAAYNFMESSKEYGQYLAGADYTFMNGLYFMVEYYRNGLGESTSDTYSFAQWMRMLGSEAENLGKDYLYIGQLYAIGELVNWSNYFMINLNDGSGMVFPWFDFSLNDNTTLILVGYIPFGKKGTEYGEFGMGGFARARIYF